MPIETKKKRLGDERSEGIAIRVARAGHPADVDMLIKELWRLYAAGELTERQAAQLDRAARSRVRYLQCRPRPAAKRLLATDDDIAALFGLELDRA
jgi:hypothetical protein